MNKEWIPVNPCANCPSRPKDKDGECSVAYVCVQYGIRIGGISAQRRLLEHLDREATKQLPLGLGRKYFQSMLKELEGQNG